MDSRGRRQIAISHVAICLCALDATLHIPKRFLLICLKILGNSEVRPLHRSVRLGETKVHASDALAQNVEQLVACRPNAIRIATEAGQRRDPVQQVQLVDDP